MSNFHREFEISTSFDGMTIIGRFRQPTFDEMAPVQQDDATAETVNAILAKTCIVLAGAKDSAGNGIDPQMFFSTLYFRPAVGDLADKWLAFVTPPRAKLEVVAA